MTYRAKYREIDPDWADVVHITHCPFDVFELPPMECPPGECKACWDREMEEVTEGGKETLPR